MNELTSLYSDILKSVGAEVDVDGLIKYRGENVTVRVSKKDKNLVLPTKEVLKSSGWMEKVAFHPACESIVADQSEVLNTLVGLGSFKVHETVQCLVADIVGLSINKEAHGKLTLKQMELLKSFESVDKASEKAFSEIYKRNTGISGKYPLLSIRLERGGEIDGVKYNRICSLIPHVLNHKDSFCGYTPSTEKSKRIVRAIYEQVLPKNMVVGTISTDCPYLMAFLNCYYEIGTHLNSIRKILGKYTTVTDITLNWFEHIDDLGKLTKRFLPQPYEGNTGTLLQDKKPVEENASNVTTPTPSVSVTETVTETVVEKPKNNKLGLVVGGSTPTNKWGIPEVPVVAPQLPTPPTAPTPPPAYNYSGGYNGGYGNTGGYGNNYQAQPPYSQPTSLAAMIVATSTPTVDPGPYGGGYQVQRQFGQHVQPNYTPQYQQQNGYRNSGYVRGR